MPRKFLIKKVHTAQDLMEKCKDPAVVDELIAAKTRNRQFQDHPELPHREALQV